MTQDSPIAVFDSGLGGLGVAREILAILPGEALVYLADSAFCPYGDRTLEEISARTVACGRALEAEGAKLLVVACNTASGAALEALRAALGIPVVGMEPALKPAAEATRAGKVGVMATAATLRTARFQRLVTEFARGAEIVAAPCAGLVELVEAGEMTGEGLRRTLEELLAPLRAAGVDQVVLGCTHYPFLADAIRDVLGPEVRLVDPAPAVARQTERVLRARGLLATGGAGGLRALTTGDPVVVTPVAARLWAGGLVVERFRVTA